jgi:putative ABC transport system permease protein
MTLWTRFLAALGMTRRDAVIDDELEAHRLHAQDELERAGLSRDAAATESRRRMGNTLLAREDSRDVWIVRWADRLRQNLRYGLRGLIRERAFALTAIVTLGLGTATVASVFSVVNAELWRPLPFPDPHSLVKVLSRGPEPRKDTDGISVQDFIEWRQAIPALSSLAAEGNSQARAVRHDFTESLRVSDVTANYFTTLGRRPIAGRVFEDSDGRGSNVAVLGSRVWKRVFESRDAVIGRTLLIDNQPYVVVGIVASVDESGPEADLFVPIDERPTVSPTGTALLYGAVGRLAPGANAETVRQQAQAQIDGRLTDQTKVGHTAEVDDLSHYYARPDARQLYFFLAASAFVLVLAIVNIAGLMLARGLRRAPEFALRGALGGGARAIIGQLTCEAALIAVPGAALGLWLTSLAMTSLGRVIPGDFLWRGAEVPIYYRALALCAGVAIVTMAGLTLAPLGIARRADAATAMALGARSSGLPRAARTREQLLIMQVALTVVLVAGGALFLKSFLLETRVPLGFDAADGWSMHVSLSGARYRDDGAVRRYANSLLAEARGIPGVRGASVATTSPLLSGWVALATEPGAAPDAPSTRSIYRAVGADYFRTIGTPLVRGRGLGDSDVAGAPPVAVVNEQFVHQFFHDADPLGREVAIKGVHAPIASGTVTVVGVAADVKEAGMNEVPFADIYLPFAQRPATSVELIVRGNGSSPAMPAALKAAAAKVDPSVPVSRVSTIDRRVSLALEQDRFNLVLAAGFAIAALLIAAIGIYGAMAYAAVARAREFGVRLALGAAPSVLMRNALWRAARLGVVGGAIGVAVAMGLAIWIGDALYLVPTVHGGLLFNVKTTDPLALAGAAGGVILVALIAGFVPARRLASIDPVKILRAD